MVLVFKIILDFDSISRNYIKLEVNYWLAFGLGFFYSKILIMVPHINVVKNIISILSLKGFSFETNLKNQS
jgi:hypothetical protein